MYLFVSVLGHATSGVLMQMLHAAIYYSVWVLLLIQQGRPHSIPTRVVGTCFCEETAGVGRNLIDLRRLICNGV